MTRHIGSVPRGHAHNTFRIYSWNLGGGLATKIDMILHSARSQRADAVCLQETGLVPNPAALERQCRDYDYKLYLKPQQPSERSVTTPGSRGVAILLHKELLPHVRTYLPHAGARALGLVLEWGQTRALVACVYMPTALERRPANHPSRLELRALLDEIASTWAAHCDCVVVCGDFNESQSERERYTEERKGVRSISASGGIGGQASDWAIQDPDFDQDEPGTNEFEASGLDAKSTDGSSSEEEQSPSEPDSEEGDSVRGMLITNRRAQLVPQLLSLGFNDAYRALHPTQPGFTYRASLANGRISHSRLDYALVKGPWEILQVALSRGDPSGRPRARNFHRSLLVVLEAPHTLRTPVKDTRPRIPNLRRATGDRLLSIIADVEAWLETHPWENAAGCVADSLLELDAHAEHLIQVTLRALERHAGITGNPPLMSKRCRALLDEIDTMRRLRTLARQLDSNSPADLFELGECLRFCKQARLPAGAEPEDLAQHLDEKLRVVRREFERERAQLRSRHSQSDWATNPPAALRKLLRSEQQPVLSIIDPSSGRLTKSKAELHAVVRGHYAQHFRAPQPLDHARAWVQNEYQPRADIDATIWEAALAPISEEELYELARDLPDASAPGVDRVSAGAWRRLLLGSALVRDRVRLLLDAYVCRHHCMPRFAKQMILVPIWKKAEGERALSNLRPIALQSSFLKLITKTLARRIGCVLTQHGVLHPAQDGFLPGHSTHDSINVLTDVLEMARGGAPGRHARRRLACIAADFASAFDKVEHGMLVRAAERLRMPLGLLQLIRSLLQGNSARVRTPYGLTESFPIERGVLQGDCLSPLLFIIAMDPLHRGLGRPPAPLPQRECGFRVSPTLTIESTAYADDGISVADSKEGLELQFRFLQEFSAANRTDLQAKKTFVCGAEANGASLVDTRLMLGDAPLRVLAPHEAFSHLGCELSVSLDPSLQAERAMRAVRLDALAVRRHRLSVSRALLFFDLHMRGRLEYLLPHVRNPSCSLRKSLDRDVGWTLSRLARLPREAKRAMLVVALGLLLPSHQLVMQLAAGAFLRMNLGGRVSASAHILWPATGTDNPRAATQTFSQFNRFVGALRLVRNELGWEARVRQEKLSGQGVRRSERRSVWPCEQKEPPHAGTQRVSFSHAGGTRGLPVALGFVGAFGMEQYRRAPGQSGVRIIAYTGSSGPCPLQRQQAILERQDGDHEALQAAWGICLRSTWFEQNEARLPPPDEADLWRAWHPPAEPEHAGLFAFAVLQAAWPTAFTAELEAIARVLTALPATFDLQIVSANQAALLAVQGFGSKTRHERLRANGRPYLRIIEQQLEQRRAYGAQTDLRYDDKQRGTACASALAHRFRLAHARNVGALLSRPWTSWDLRLGCDALHYAVRCEQRPDLAQEPSKNARIIVEDVRKAALRAMRVKALHEWRNSQSQSAFACAEMSALGDYLRRADLPTSQQSLLLRASTDQLHLDMFRIAGTRRFGAHACSMCCGPRQAASTLHVLSCSSVGARAIRANAAQRLRVVLAKTDSGRLLIRHTPALRSSEPLHVLYHLFQSKSDRPLVAPRVQQWRLMLGVFTARECGRARLTGGLDEAGMDELRSTLLDMLQQLERSAKRRRLFLGAEAVQGPHSDEENDAD